MFAAWREIKYLATKDIFSLVLTTKHSDTAEQLPILCLAGINHSERMLQFTRLVLTNKRRYVSDAEQRFGPNSKVPKVLYFSIAQLCSVKLVYDIDSFRVIGLFWKS